MSLQKDKDDDCPRCQRELENFPPKSNGAHIALKIGAGAVGLRHPFTSLEAKVKLGPDLHQTLHSKLFQL